MRADAAQYDLSALPSLDATLRLLAEGRHTPLAGGTELMVALSAGRLPHKPLLSIAHLRELRFLRVEPDQIVIGAGTTFTDLRRNTTIASELPLLSLAASWTGSIANQNRGTMGGNLVNASPAADSPPALLCYEAELTLISADGSRTLPYTAFHLAYKKTALRPDELVYSIAVRRAFTGWHSYLRKVGTRNAQAISKIALAGLARVEGLSEIPLRCRAAEAALRGKRITSQTIAEARAALASEAKPIDDIRSTAAYRAAVAGNLLEEFLQSLCS
jgi:CO/xanthine dehydrogenase FAD-binding subunit